MNPGTYRLARLGLVALALMLPAGARAEAPTDTDTTGPALAEVEFLGEHVLQAGATFWGTCVGGLSAIDYDAASDRFYLLADDRRRPRFYVAELVFAAGGAAIAELRFERVVELRTREGAAYPDGRVDPEGLALLRADAAFISSEGVAAAGVPPFVDLVDLATGGWLASVPLPEAFTPRHQAGSQVQGVRNNLGLESLALSPDRHHLYTASESSLLQDTGEEVAGTPLFARLLHYELAGTVPRLAGDYLYPLVYPTGQIIAHGLVELSALDDHGRLLALDRAYGQDVGHLLQLYEVRLAEAQARADAPRPVVPKHLLLDFADLPTRLENFEGITRGPRLADGGETLLILADNNRVECATITDPAAEPPTKLLLFRLRR